MKMYSDLSNQEYHSLNQHVSSSFVKSVAKHSIDRAMLKLDATPALLFGDAMHTYFESREQFHKRFVIFDDEEIIKDILERRPDITTPSMTKDYKIYKSDFESSLEPDQSVISAYDMDRIKHMYNSAVTNEGLKSIYDMYDYDEFWDEYSFISDEEDLWGLKYRVRPDRMLVRDMEPLAIIDWKSCQDASEKAFRSDFWRYRYDLQAVFYCDVLSIPAQNFYFVAIEKEFPYNTAVYSLSEEAIVNTALELNRIKSRISQWKKNPTPQTSGLENSNKITLL
jgi:hypothetical protein